MTRPPLYRPVGSLARNGFALDLAGTARVQLESRALWPFYHAGGIEREVRNAMMATWDEAHMFRCLAWLYDGFRFPNVPA